MGMTGKELRIFLRANNVPNKAFVKHVGTTMGRLTYATCQNEKADTNPDWVIKAKELAKDVKDNPDKYKTDRAAAGKKAARTLAERGTGRKRKYERKVAPENTLISHRGISRKSANPEKELTEISIKLHSLVAEQSALRKRAHQLTGQLVS